MGGTVTCYCINGPLSCLPAARSAAYCGLLCLAYSSPPGVCPARRPRGGAKETGKGNRSHGGTPPPRNSAPFARPPVCGGGVCFSCPRPSCVDVCCALQSPGKHKMLCCSGHRQPARRSTPQTHQARKPRSCLASECLGCCCLACLHDETAATQRKACSCEPPARQRSEQAASRKASKPAERRRRRCRLRRKKESLCSRIAGASMRRPSGARASRIVPVPAKEAARPPSQPASPHQSTKYLVLAGYHPTLLVCVVAALLPAAQHPVE